jgi:hypothetical protein
VSVFHILDFYTLGAALKLDSGWHIKPNAESAARRIIACLRVAARVRRARFVPKDASTLRESIVPHVGIVYDWDFVGVGGDDEPYPGQSRWTPCRQHDVEFLEEARGLWAPDEDLEDI